ncbi:MAG: phosphatidylcholine/phosphatidylserine synthase [Alphaproteobacteria bacterium]|nr:phosphatidylcholine/phosphatidylserine synthase [Alphaproteobacteria bacterium]
MDLPRDRARERLRQFPIVSLSPNILTLLALCAGLTGIRFALNGQWELAVAAVLIAALFDGLDGRLARLLKTASKFGAELDSLADFVSFGVVPGLILYLWSLDAAGRIGWVLALAYIVCVGLRLARFNTALEDPTRAVIAAHFFTGVPSPAGAGLALLPMILYFQFEAEFLRSAALVGLWILLMGFLMVSQIPTFAFKKLRVRRDRVLPMLLLVGVFAALIANLPWLTLAGVGIAYLATFPFGVMAFRRMKASGGFDVPAALAVDATADKVDVGSGDAAKREG